MIVKTVKDLKEIIKDLPDDMLVLRENQTSDFHSPVCFGIETMVRINPHEYSINMSGKNCLIIPI